MYNAEVMRGDILVVNNLFCFERCELAKKDTIRLIVSRSLWVFEINAEYEKMLIGTNEENNHTTCTFTHVEYDKTTILFFSGKILFGKYPT